MTWPYRKCAFGVVPPTIEIFGELYGHCAMTSECPQGECGYERSRRIVAEERAHGEEARAEDAAAAPGSKP